MEKIKDVQLKEQLTEKIKRGDFITLGKVLKINANAARMQFKRGKKKAFVEMSNIIENREEYITNYALKSRSVIIDCAITKESKFLVVIQYEGKHKFCLYENVTLLKHLVSDFITEVFKEVPATIKLAVTDCSIGYLPEVITTIRKFGFKQAFKHASAANVEAVIGHLSNKN